MAGKKEAIKSAHRPSIQSKKDELLARRNTLRSSKISEERKQAIKSQIEARKAQDKANKAIQSRNELVKMHEAEERQRLFQSSQTQMNEEKFALKSASNRNNAALEKLYNSMF